MRVFECGYWVVQCGPNQSWKFLEAPDRGPHMQSLGVEEMKQLAVLAHAAVLWLDKQVPGGPIARP